ncbi:hypothetical protein VTL71DRAFT_9786 [Oculimacula yallundae]|uniref:Carboxylic ester hydrolase n=1 Tax=Oculimacula yallundae TaxID=86028 RepID=A0ABR4BTG2_9HELO
MELEPQMRMVPRVSEGDLSSSQTLLDAEPTSNQIPSTIKPTQDFHPRILKRERTIIGWWKYEILASFVAVGALMALMLIMSYFQGRPQDEISLPGSLQLSAIIAALSTVIRAALLVPVTSALSQDAWLWLADPKQRPSRKSRLVDMEVTDEASRGPWGCLLFLFEARRRYTAFIAALVIILSLTISTFTQQTLVFEMLPIHSGRIIIPNIPRSQSWSTYQAISDASTRYLSSSIKAAINHGFFASNIQPVPVSCITGNCTWPETASLAVCGGCTESTFTMECDPDSTRKQYCNYTSPSGTKFLNESGVYFASMNGQGAIYNSSDDNRRYLANWDLGGVNSSLYLPDSWNRTTYKSQECALWVCVKSYSAIVQGTHQVTTEIAEWSTIIDRGNYTSGHKVNSTFGNPLHDLNPGGRNYSVTDQAIGQINIFMSGFFNGNVYMPGMHGIGYSNDFIELFYNATMHNALDAFVKNIAMSMSNVFRTAEPAQDDYFNGTASTLSVVIRWRWMAIPIILVALSVIVSAINIVRTYKTGVGAWKGSPLALLACDIDLQLKYVAAVNMDVPNGLSKSIGGSKVVLTKDDQAGWIFQVSN